MSEKGLATRSGRHALDHKVKLGPHDRSGIVSISIDTAIGHLGSATDGCVFDRRSAAHASVRVLDAVPDADVLEGSAFAHTHVAYFERGRCRDGRVDHNA